MTAAGTDLANALLADRYRLLTRIAVGGMGEVWRAEDVALSRAVAVKTLRSEYSSETDRSRFRAEARHAARLAHPGIASVYDFGESADRAWLVMELVEGEPLSHLLQRRLRCRSTARWTSSSKPRWPCTPRTSAVWCTGTSSPAICCCGRTASSR
jgi:serine/threonine protein kinase